MRVPGWAGRYIGLPFVDGGRDFSGVDCEGLCRLMMLHEAGNPPVPSYGILSADGLANVARAVEENAALPPWVKVERGALRKFDWAIMLGREKIAGRPRSVPCHLGIMLDGQNVLHIEKATHSAAQSLEHPLLQPRLFAFVRHEALA